MANFHNLTLKLDAEDAQRWVKKFLAEFQVIEAEHLARLFHDTCKRLAPDSYSTWEDAEDDYTQLMIAVFAEILQKYICGYVRNNGYLPEGESVNESSG